MHLPDNTRRLPLIYVTVCNTENTEMLCNNNIQILMKLGHEIKQQQHTEQVTIAPTVLSATGLVTACITLCKCLNDEEGLSNNIQRAALLGTSHTVCEFLSPQAELTFIISLVKAVITIMVNQCNTETEHIQGASKKFGEWMDISKAT